MLKKLQDIPQERNTEPTKLMRKEYVEWLAQIQPVYELIFINETGINQWCNRTRGRARIGDPAIRIVNGRHGQNFAVVFAISSRRGLISHDLFVGGMKGERFVSFLNDISQANINNQINAPCHLRALQPPSWWTKHKW